MMTGVMEEKMICLQNREKMMIELMQSRLENIMKRKSNGEK